MDTMRAMVASSLTVHANTDSDACAKQQSRCQLESSREGAGASARESSGSRQETQKARHAARPGKLNKQLGEERARLGRR